MNTTTLINMKCNWSEIIDGNLLHCLSKETERDFDNHQERYFCEVHMEFVKNIRLEMFIKQAKKYGYIDLEKYKLKIIDYILSESYQSAYAIPEVEHLVWNIDPRTLINKIENGEFE